LEERAREQLGGLLLGADEHAARVRAVHVDPRVDLVRERGDVPVPGVHEARLAVDHRGEHLLGDLQDGVAPGDLGDVDGAGHASSSCCTSPRSWSLSLMASGVNGLMTYSCAPAASARTICPCSLSVVTIISVM